MEFNEFNGRKRSPFGYFMAAFCGAVMGGLLLLLLGPGTLFSNISQPAPQQSPSTVGYLTGQQVTSSAVGYQGTAMGYQGNATGNQGSVPVTTPQGITDVGFAASKVMPAVVGIVRPVKNTTGNPNETVAEIGTGVVVDSSGYILTNNHVADLSKSLTISLYDGRTVTGKVVWTDSVLDISIVKVDQSNLTAAVLGNSKTVKIGDTAIAIGNPLGLKFQRSVTSGIISALNRTVQMSQNAFMEDLIQTDASINPGNSGGPLININGEVIGINTVKVATAEGMGFAIPINMAKPIIRSIKATGKFVEPGLGIKGLDMAMADYYDYKVERGVYVNYCDPAGPGYKAGIRQGDRIISINGTSINTLLDLKENLYSIGIGGTANITLDTPSGNDKLVKLTLIKYK